MQAFSRNTLAFYHRRICSIKKEARFKSLSPQFGSAKKASSTETEVSNKSTLTETEMANHSWRQQNRIWTEEELCETYKSKILQHTPVTFSDHVMHKLMRFLYRGFNFVTVMPTLST